MRGLVEKVIPPGARETLYRYVSAGITGLTAVGKLDIDTSVLWTQLALATITLVFAILYSDSTIRTALYWVVATGGGVLMAYGILHGVNWALVVAAIGQVLGTATAAAKTFPGPVNPGPRRRFPPGSIEAA